MLALLHVMCCMGKVQSWRRAVPAVDVDGVRRVHVPVRPACNGCVSELTDWTLEGWNLQSCLSLWPW